MRQLRLGGLASRWEAGLRARSAAPALCEAGFKQALLVTRARLVAGYHPRVVYLHSMSLASSSPSSSASVVGLPAGARDALVDTLLMYVAELLQEAQQPGGILASCPYVYLSVEDARHICRAVVKQVGAGSVSDSSVHGLGGSEPLLRRAQAGVREAVDAELRRQAAEIRGSLNALPRQEREDIDQAQSVPVQGMGVLVEGPVARALQQGEWERWRQRARQQQQQHDAEQTAPAPGLSSVSLSHALSPSSPSPSPSSSALPLAPYSGLRASTPEELVLGMKAKADIQEREAQQQQLGHLHRQHHKHRAAQQQGQGQGQEALRERERKVAEGDKGRSAEAAAAAAESEAKERDKDKDKPVELPTAVEEAIEEEIFNEVEAVESTVRRYQELIDQLKDRKLAGQLSPAQRILLDWFEPLIALINAEKDKYANAKGQASGDLEVYGPKLEELDAAQLACVAIHETLAQTLFEPTGVRVASLLSAIGRAVQNEVNLLLLKRQPQFVTHVKKKGVRVSQELVRRFGPEGRWDNKVILKVGGVLLKMLTEAALFTVEGKKLPVFTHSMLSASDVSKVKSLQQAGLGNSSSPFSTGDSPLVEQWGTGMLSMDERVLAKLTDAAEVMDKLRPRFPPMVTKPRPWTAFNRGGYLGLETKIMRTHGSRAQMEACARSEMPHLYEALTGLGNVTWKVNRRVLDVAERLWAKGGDVAGLTPANPLPEREAQAGAGAQHACDAVAVADSDALLAPAMRYSAEGGVSAEYRAWQRELDRVRKINAERYSLKCDTQYKLDTARRFADHVPWQERKRLMQQEQEKGHGQEGPAIPPPENSRSWPARPLWFPFNIDFRGRAYPIPPHLNHIGSDLSRGLLMFYHGRELGEKGLRWLKIHLANVNGANKLTLDEREQWAMDRLDLIRAAAADPYGEVSPAGAWWMQAEEPFQCLATCFELDNALRWGERHGDPLARDFKSCLPVHQDGSCNGLQHYAALGRDELGALHVNLIPSERPQDVYSGVCDLVNKKLARDAADASHPNHALARKLLGHVGRKVVKQTVMTSVYGVTYLGARDQILKQLRAIDALQPIDPASGRTGDPQGRFADDAEMRHAAGYLASLTLSSLGDIFTNAFKIMAWLRQCTRSLSALNQPTCWMTPLLNLAVMQPYRRSHLHTVSTMMQQVTIAEHSDLLPIDKEKQESAFPPNFVHSLDATHMFLTALECDKRGITFSSVHDSYWTHAGSLDDMNTILRQQFVRLYSLPILEDLAASLSMRYPDAHIPALPARGGLDINVVNKSTYFFS